MPSALIERQNVNATRRLVVAATVVAFAGIGAAAEEQVLAFAAAEPIALAKTGLKSWPSLPVPLLATLALHRDARRISHLDPCWVRPGPVGRAETLRDNPLRAKSAGMGEYRRSVRRDVLAKAERSRFTEERCKGRLPGLDWQAAQIVAVNLDQIERVEHRDVASTTPPQRLEIGEPVRPDDHGLAV